MTQWLDGQVKAGIRVTCDRARDRARDRAPVYIRALIECVLQVADRWHLLQNMREVMQRLLGRHRDDIEQVGRDATLKQTMTSWLETAKIQVLPALAILNPQFSRRTQGRARTLTSQIGRQQCHEQVQGLKA